LVARQRRPPSAGQQLETIGEAGGERLEAERGDARRRQLDRQRNAVEPPANRRDQGHKVPVRHKMRQRRLHPLDEQPNGTVLQRILPIFGVAHRDVERRHRIDLFSLSPKGLAAGGEDSHRRAGSQHRLRHARGGFDHVLAGVQHQQQWPVGERLRHALCRSLAATKLEPDSGGNRGGNQAGIGERRELGQPYTLGKLRQ
jgi:hypothetical protein